VEKRILYYPLRPVELALVKHPADDNIQDSVAEAEYFLPNLRGEFFSRYLLYSPSLKAEGENCHHSTSRSCPFRSLIAERIRNATRRSHYAPFAIAVQTKGVRI
jgi:hypothetical protein